MSIVQIKENGFTLKKKQKARNRRYPAETTTDTDYADDQALLASTPDQAESLLHSLQQPVWGICLYGIVNNIWHSCFKREGVISTLNARHLKLVDKFTYVSSNISSTVSKVKICLAKAWTAIDRLSMIRKSDVFQAVAVSILVHGCTRWTLRKYTEKKLDCNTTRTLTGLLNKSGK